MRTIEKKTWPKYFEAISKNRKHFEVRLADFKIQEKDNLILKEWDPKKKKYTGKKLKFKVWTVLRVPNDMQRFYSKKDIKRYGFFVIELKK